jgi:hypothetical protein
MSDHRLHHYLQWFPGKENSVADALSRDFWLGDVDAVNFLKQNFAHQIPQGSQLDQLPETIVTDIVLILRLMPKTQLLPLRPAPSGTAAGGGTSASSAKSGTNATSSSPHVLRCGHQVRLDRRGGQQKAMWVDETFRMTSWI